MDIKVNKSILVKGVTIEVEAELHYDKDSDFMDWVECSYWVGNQDVFSLMSEEALKIADDLILIYANQEVR